jgi:hypothetical protein
VRWIHTGEKVIPSPPHIDTTGQEKKAGYHDLKTWPQYFEAVRLGVKTFELRKDDRGFRVGDVLTLREWNPDSKEFTGRWLTRQIRYIAKGVFGLPEDMAILSMAAEIVGNGSIPSVIPFVDSAPASIATTQGDEKHIHTWPVGFKECAVCGEPKPAPQAEGLTLVEDRNGDKRHYQSDEVDAYVAPLLQKIEELEKDYAELKQGYDLRVEDVAHEMDLKEKAEARVAELEAALEVEKIAAERNKPKTIGEEKK